MENVQFEYYITAHRFDVRLNRYEEYAIPKFLTVLDTFEHHYTGERMCRIREEWVTEDGHGMADEKIVREEAVLKLMGESK